MSLPLFLDANIPLYAAGRPHALKEPCREILRLAGGRPQAFFTNAEVLQELLHRYLALRLWPQGREVLLRVATLMRDRIEPVHAADVLEAARLADQHPALSARDLVHAAVMMRVGSDQIISADRGFDRLPQLTRLDPAHLSSWRDQIESA